MKFKILVCWALACASTLAQGNTLTVYSARKEHLIKDIFEAYEKKTGIKIKYKTGQEGELIQNLLAEKSSPVADILLTVDAGNLWHAASVGLLESIDSAALKKAVPDHLRDEEGRWFGLSVRARTTVVNTQKFPKGTELSYEGLAEPKWKGQLCLRSSKKVYNQSLIAMLIDTHGEKKTKEIVKGWVDNNVEIYSDDTAVLKALAAGRCTVGIVNTYYLGKLLEESPELPLAVVWPNQKTGQGVHVNVSGAGIVKGSKNKKMAQDFLEWLASDEAQKSFAQVNLEYPVVEGAPWAKIVESWGKFKANNSFKLSKAGQLQKSAIKVAQEVGYQ